LITVENKLVRARFLRSVHALLIVCHPERSRSSGEAKDLQLHWHRAQAKFRHHRKILLTRNMNRKPGGIRLIILKFAFS
jgi:hypothetical protein